MRVTQEIWRTGCSPGSVGGQATDGAPQLVLVFASSARLKEQEIWTPLHQRWPNAVIIAGSTAGEICGVRVFDESLVATAVEFEQTRVRHARVNLTDAATSVEVGRRLADQLLAPDLVHVLVLSDGLKVNGSELVAGLTERLPPNVAVTGGLCGDGSRFERTYVCVNEFSADENVVVIGFYGSELRVGFGSLGGWDPFGPERRVTRSVGNIVFELDGAPALDLYEKYLGEHATELPASGLLFPLTVRQNRDEPGVVRTILAVDRVARSLTFAGDVPTGYFARLMRTNFDRLIDGASGAAHACYEAIGSKAPALAILISCVGRKLVLKQRIEEEVEAVQSVLGEKTVLTGFYSYGEISPFTPFCSLRIAQSNDDDHYALRRIGVHKLLERQVRRCFGSTPPIDQTFTDFLAAVDSAYQEGDSDRALLERSIELASAELLERNAQLERDIEAIKRLELGLFQAEKLRAVGQLAAGIAHEINTPIQYVGDSVFFLKGAFADLSKLGDSVSELCDAFDKGEVTNELLRALKFMAADLDLEYLLSELPRAFEQTTEGIRRVAKIVAAMKEFGRVDQFDRVPTDIVHCIENTLTVVRNELRFVAEIEVNLTPVPLVLCQPGELGQVILNLLVNAAHAIDDRFHGQSRQGLVRVDLAQGEREVVISVSDNGCGIPESQRHRIFEPFFTTKPVGKGTGQGLAISQAIVNKQGGSLRFESQVGQGTTFYVHLPLANENESAVSALPSLHAT